jgi:DNA repair protein RadC
MRDYDEVPERMRVTGANPACRTAPTAKQFQGYEGMSVQLCPASKPWPKDFKFAGAQDVVEFAKLVGMIDDMRERIYAIYCDQKNVPQGYRLVSSGGVTETIADPKVVFQPAAALAAPGIFLVHNHPSGAPAPSPMDNALTERRKRVAEYMGFRLVDHVVVGTQGFYSYADDGKV